jgi:hypothetical protein
MIAIIFPSLHPVANISGGKYSGTLFIPKVPLETASPPPPESFDASYAPVNFNHIRHQAWTSLCHKGCFTYNSSNPNRDCKPFLINCGVSISLEEIGGYPNFKGGGLRNT